MTHDKPDREYARFEVRIGVRLRPVDPDECEVLSAELLRSPSVWGPAGERELRDLVIGASQHELSLAAQGVLDVADELVRLRARLDRPGDTFLHGTLLELSGGGGQVAVPGEPDRDARFELRFDDFDSEIPPLRALIRIVHRYGSESDGYGFAFETVHPKDRDRLIGFIYRIQRRALRRAHDQREEAAG